MTARLEQLAWWVVSCAAIAAAAVVLYQRAATLPESTSQDEFARTVRQLRSDVLEAKTLAEAVAAGQLTRHFAVEHHEMLADDIRDVRRALDQPPPRGATQQWQRARAVAERLDTLLSQVPASLVDAQALQRMAAEEAALSASLGESARP